MAFCGSSDSRSYSYRGKLHDKELQSAAAVMLCQHVERAPFRMKPCYYHQISLYGYIRSVMIILGMFLCLRSLPWWSQVCVVSFLFSASPFEWVMLRRIHSSSSSCRCTAKKADSRPQTVWLNFLCRRGGNVVVMFLPPIKMLYADHFNNCGLAAYVWVSVLCDSAF